MRCVICDKKITNWGNNPYPIRTDSNARCCDACNSKYVIAGRIALINRSQAEAVKMANLFNTMKLTDLNKIFKLV